MALYTSLPQWPRLRIELTRVDVGANIPHLGAPGNNILNHQEQRRAVSLNNNAAEPRPTSRGAQRENRDHRVGLRLAQLNMRRARHVTDELRTEAVKSGIDVILMQEPYTFRGNIPGFGLSCCLSSVSAGEGEGTWAGIAILNPKLKATQLAELSSGHCVCAEIQSELGPFYIVSIYFQHSEPTRVGIAHVERILQRLQGQKVLIAADSNARSTMWGDRLTDPSGEELETLIAQYNLFVLNEPGTLPTFESPNGTSFIDITLATEQMLPWVKSWTVKKDWTTSDHRVIVTTLKTDNSQEQPIIASFERYNLRKGDWGKFADELSNAPPAFNGDLTVSENIASIIGKLRSAADTAIPLRKPRAKTVPWWTPELTQLKRLAHRRRRQYQWARSRSSDDDIERKKRAYKDADRKYKSVIYATRRDSYRSLLNEAKDSNNPWELPYRLAVGKILQRRILSNIKRPDGTMTLSRQETFETLLDVHFPRDPQENDTEQQRESRRTCREASEGENAPAFTLEDLQSAVKRQKNRKCPGYDLIESEIFKQAMPYMHEDLLGLYNQCLESGRFPDEWKLAEVIFLLKAPEKDPKEPKSYRPISLLSVLGKVFERMLGDKLTPVFEHEELAAERQYGFREHRSTTDAICTLREIAELKGRNSKYVLGMAFDISGAFDNLWIPSILQSLKERGCPDNIFKVLVDYFTQRKIRAKDEYVNVERHTERGCPQGSILGPRCWNLVFDGLLNLLERQGLEAVAYADDLIVIIDGNSRLQIETLGQIVVETIEQWCNEQKLVVSSQKSEMIFLKYPSGVQPHRRPPTIHLGGQRMRLEKSIRYLGVYLDEKLVGMKTHCAKLESRTRNLFNALGKVARANWGLDFGVMQSIYDGLFVPIVTYAAPSWHDLLNEHNLRKLRSIQRTALLRVSQAYRTISNDALCVLTGKCPIDLVLTERVCLRNLKLGKPFQIGNYSYDPTADEERRVAKANLKGSKVELWQARWASSQKGRTTWEYLPNIKERLRAKWLKLDHYSCQLMSGHGNIRSKLCSFALVPDNFCQCGEVETADHIIYGCPLRSDPRRELTNGLRKIGLNWPLPPRQLPSKECFPLFKRFARAVLQTPVEIQGA